MPEGVSKTFAMDCFTKGKAKNGNKRETSELDIQGFEWAMRKIARQTGADFASLHVRITFVSCNGNALFGLIRSLADRFCVSFLIRVRVSA